MSTSLNPALGLAWAQKERGEGHITSSVGSSDITQERAPNMSVGVQKYLRRVEGGHLQRF